jgi:glycosyltransferase involved in cell wall biosynthesis
VAEIIVQDYGLEGHVFAPREFAVPTIYHPLGRYAAADFDPNSTPLTMHFLAARNGDVRRYGFEPRPLKVLLQDLRPAYIWLHTEFWDGLAGQFLWHYRFNRNPRLFAYMAINELKNRTPLFSTTYPFLSRTRLRQIFLWPRLNGVFACATKSADCARRLGLPRSIPITINYLPVFGPEWAAENHIPLPWPRGNSFIIGFVGVLNEQKGWKVLLDAVERLPKKFKLVLVGDGEQRKEMLSLIERPVLKDRVYYAGALPKETLLATYALFNVLILPSITTSYAEQFGAVLAEAMACGVPVIGSDSGGIPETVGKAGLIVPEQDPKVLAEAIFKISEDEDFRRCAAAWGQERYKTKYSLEAYALSIFENLIKSSL